MIIYFFHKRSSTSEVVSLSVRRFLFWAFSFGKKKRGSPKRYPVRWFRNDKKFIRDSGSRIFSVCLFFRNIAASHICDADAGYYKLFVIERTLRLKQSTLGRGVD